MKNVAVIACFLISTVCYGQKDTACFYGELGGGVGTGGNVRLDLNCLFGQNNIISIGFYKYWHKSYDIPLGFTVAKNESSDGVVRYAMNLGTIMYGKMITLSKARFSLKGGLGMGARRVPEDFTRRISAPNGPNGAYKVYYVYNDVYTPMAAIILNPGVEFPFAYGMGLKLGVTSVINSYRSTCNVDATVLFGRLKKNKPRYSKSEKKVRLKNYHRKEGL